MSEEEVIQAHPEGEVQTAGNQPAEAVTSLDTFTGKVHVKWAPEAAVSSLGLLPFFIEFLETNGGGTSTSGAIRGDGINPALLGMTGLASEDSLWRGMKAMNDAASGE